MPAQQIEITGVLIDERRPPNCDNFVICTINPIVDGQVQRGTILKCVGNAEPGELKLHLAYRWFGVEKNDPRFGKQIAFQTFTPAKPHGREGVVRYLQQCDGIGAATANAIWNAFGSDSVRICREHPEVVAGKIQRLKPDVCEAMAAKLDELSALEDTSIELIDLLHGRGFPKATAREAVRRWGNKAPWVIQHDAYKLMAFRGCGFLRCDSLWMDLGLPPAKLKRQVCCAWYSVASDTEGHSWFPDSKANEYLKAKIAGVELDLEKALALGARAKAIAIRRWCDRCKNIGTVRVPDLFTGESLVDVPCPACGSDPLRRPRWIAEHKKASAEDFVAKHLAAAERETDPVFVSHYEDEIERTIIIPEFTRCTRCHRKLTAVEVAVLNGQPYGPDCITKIAGGENADRLPLAEWLASHPEVRENRTARLSAIEEAKFVNHWPLPSELENVSDHQREKYELATIGRIGVLGGSPGSGKTYVAAAIVKAILKRFGQVEVAICAPTGKAAVRCTESMRAYGLNLRACTIHSLLGVESSEDGNWSFKHNENFPLPYKFIITDESSMIDTSIMRSLLAARARGTHILFVGDVNQLPPVGHGAPLRDIIAAGLPTGVLTEIRRNAGTIVRACAQIRDNKPFEVDAEIDLKAEAPKNLQLIQSGKSQCAAAIEKKIVELRDAGIDPIWAVQVIVAVNKKSPLARVTLNKRLQELLNPGGRGVAGSPFRVGDKVICLRNSFFKAADPFSEASNDRGQVAVANGEFGKVLAVEEKKTTVQFFNPDRKVEVSRASVRPEKDDGKDDAKADDASGTGCDLDLGYAVTCHKCQGSDCDYIIVALDEYPGAVGRVGICKREWLYTAISRARLACYLIGLRSTAQTMCRETALQKRKTFLCEQIDVYRREFAKFSPSAPPSMKGFAPCSIPPVAPPTEAGQSITAPPTSPLAAAVIASGQHITS